MTTITDFETPEVSEEVTLEPGEELIKQRELWEGTACFTKWRKSSSRWRNERNDEQ